MAKPHWTTRYDMQTAPLSIAQRAKGMLQRSGSMADVDVVSARSIKVGMPEGFDDVTDPLGVARRDFRSNKIDAVARVLRVEYVIEFVACDDDTHVFVNFL